MTFSEYILELSSREPALGWARSQPASAAVGPSSEFVGLLVRDDGQVGGLPVAVYRAVVDERGGPLRLLLTEHKPFPKSAVRQKRSVFGALDVQPLDVRATEVAGDGSTSVMFGVAGVPESALRLMERLDPRRCCFVVDQASRTLDELLRDTAKSLRIDAIAEFDLPALASRLCNEGSVLMRATPQMDGVILIVAREDGAMLKGIQASLKGRSDSSSQGDSRDSEMA